MPNQIAKRTHAVHGNPRITNTQPPAPKSATGQTNGILNGRGRSGSRTRRMSTPMQTSTKAKSVPMFVRS